MHIFLSYRMIEAEFSLQLAEDLKQAGISIWMDQLAPGLSVGDNWVSELQDAIQNAVGFVAVVSQAYVESKFCMRELLRADALKIPIFPLLIGDVSERIWPFPIQDKQYLDFRNCVKGSECYKKKFAELMTALKSLNLTGMSNLLDEADKNSVIAVKQMEEDILTLKNEANPASSDDFIIRKRQRLQKRLELLYEEWEAVNNHLDSSLNSGDQVRIQRQIEILERKIHDVCAEINSLEI